MTQYALDARVSRFQVQAFAAGPLARMGHNPTIDLRDFSAQAKLRPEALDGAALQLKIRAGSLAVTDNIKDKDRREIERVMHEDVLESARYPEIVFETSGVSGDVARAGQQRVILNGKLSLRGVTQIQLISAYLTVNENTLRAHGEFTIRQSDYNISPVSVAGGALKLKDELKFTFDIVMRRKPD